MFAQRSVSVLHADESGVHSVLWRPTGRADAPNARSINAPVRARFSLGGIGDCGVYGDCAANRTDLAGRRTRVCYGPYRALVSSEFVHRRDIGEVQRHHQSDHDERRDKHRNLLCLSLRFRFHSLGNERETDVTGDVYHHYTDYVWCPLQVWRNHGCQKLHSLKILNAVRPASRSERRLDCTRLR